MADVKLVNDVALASMKTFGGLAAASVKTINGVDAAAGGSGNNFSVSLVAASSQSCSIANASQTGLDFASDFTIEFWYKPTTAPISVSQNLTDRWIGSGNDRSYQFGFTSGGANDMLQTRISSSGESGGTTLDGTTNLDTTMSTATWYHIALVYTSSTTTFEIFRGTVGADDVSTGVENTTPSSVYQAAITQYFFANGGANTYVDGLINDMRFWSTAKSLAALNAARKTVPVGNETNLEGAWYTENNHTDATANSNDLTAANTPTFSADTPY